LSSLIELNSLIISVFQENYSPQRLALSEAEADDG
jgi:hypothetical protein